MLPFLHISTVLFDWSGEFAKQSPKFVAILCKKHFMLAFARKVCYTDFRIVFRYYVRYKYCTVKATPCKKKTKGFT